MCDERDKQHAEAFRDLESKICDLVRMAQIATQFACDNLSSTEGYSADDAEERDRALFAVGHVLDMAKQMKASYLAVGEEQAHAA